MKSNLYGGLALITVFAVGIGLVGLTNEKGVILFNFVKLSVFGATVFYCGLALLMLLCASLFLPMLVRNLKGPMMLVVDESSVIVPRASLRNELLTIPYDSIKQVLVQKVQDQEFVTIESSLGQARVMAMGFGGGIGFEMFKKALFERMNKFCSR